MKKIFGLIEEEEEEEEEVLQSNTSIHKITVRNCIVWENGMCAEQQTQEE